MPKQLTGALLLILSHPLHNFAMLGDIPWYAPYIVAVVGLVIFLKAEIRDNQKKNQM